MYVKKKKEEGRDSRYVTLNWARVVPAPAAIRIQRPEDISSSDSPIV